MNSMPNFSNIQHLTMNSPNVNTINPYQLYLNANINGYAGSLNGNQYNGFMPLNNYMNQLYLNQNNGMTQSMYMANMLQNAGNLNLMPGYNSNININANANSNANSNGIQSSFLQVSQPTTALLQPGLQLKQQLQFQSQLQPNIPQPDNISLQMAQARMFNQFQLKQAEQLASNGMISPQMQTQMDQMAQAKLFIQQNNQAQMNNLPQMSYQPQMNNQINLMNSNLGNINNPANNNINQIFGGIMPNTSIQNNAMPNLSLQNNAMPNLSIQNNNMQNTLYG